ncbi:MerR family transcriptional regulator [uncultured Ilyobacter sp.]|uniref:MerR family transcriptional regulator n=1 Tax=uncultured Ilyobacter sp. TaxID=544433 RepID=UPI0029C75DE2|nr:MerR family transcriptional regulator [uncultured Ilyobacter sp.]
MDSNNFLKISEFGRLGKTSRKMLIHYDKMDILKPAYIDPDTKYRYYSIQQIKSLAMIKSLQAIGVSLGEIKEKYLNTTIKEYIKNLKKEEIIIEKKLAEIQMAKKILEDKLNCLEEIANLSDKIEFKIKEMPLRYLMYSVIESKKLEDIPPVILALEKKNQNRDFLIVGDVAAVKEFYEDGADKVTLLGIFSNVDRSEEGFKNCKFDKGEYLCFHRDGYFLEGENSQIIDEWCIKNGYRAMGNTIIIPLLIPFLNLIESMYQVQVRVEKL